MNVKTAIWINVEVFGNTLDRSGVLAYFHGLSVMNDCPAGDAQVVGAIHDVIEDIEWLELDDLWTLTKEQRDALDAISRRDGETYRDYILRVNQDALATTVKLVDLKHNMSRGRMKGCNPGLMVRYVQSVEFLTSGEWKSKSELKKEAKLD